MFGTFDPKDVTLLLKDISGMVEPMSTPEREARIQAGTPYCEMLPIEYEPSEAYLRAYRWALERHGKRVAQAAANAAAGIVRKRGRDAARLARARRHHGGHTDKAVCRNVSGRAFSALLDLHHPRRRH